MSVVVPLFNKAGTILHAVQSVLRQTVSALEVLVVDDGSTDGSGDVVRALGDSRVRVVTQNNQGVSAARNRGIAEARSDLIAFLDADDEWDPDFLETVLALRLRFPSARVFATSYRIRQGEYVRPAILRGVAPGFQAGLLEHYFEVATQSDPPITASSVVITREAIDSVGRFPVGIMSGEDLLTWAKLAARYDIAYARSPKSEFRAPTHPRNRPGRVPHFPDLVGAQLDELGRASSQRTVGIGRYLARWHEMRATVLLQLRRRSEARFELRSALRHVRKPKLWLLFLATLAPPGAAGLALKLARAALRAVRRKA